MAVVKHGGLRDDGCLDHESDDCGMLEKENGYRKRYYKRVQLRARPREYRVNAREKAIEEREVMNGAYGFTCSRSHSRSTEVIRSIKSRANDAESPPDEGDISEYEHKPKMRRKTSSVSGEVRGCSRSTISEVEEAKREDSKGNRGKYLWSSSDSFHENDENNEENDSMEIDDDHNQDGANVSVSDDHNPQRSSHMLQGCRSVDEFEKLNKIGEGTFGVVFRANDKKTGEIVALKQVKMMNEREGFPTTSLREINILVALPHPSIVGLKEVVVGDVDSIFMVMEYVEYDIKALMENMGQPFSQSEVKCLMLQLLEGVRYLHDNWLLHRDLKPSNLLLNKCGELKICDFGLARKYGNPLRPYTQPVATLWYRAPELLLGAKEYSPAIDMWSVGCIMAELLSKEPLFKGKTELDQLDKMFRLLGTPNEAIWPGFSKLPRLKANFVKHRYNLLRRKFPAMSLTGPVLSDVGFDLLNKLLTYDPKKRITAEKALNHEWFQEVALPKQLFLNVLLAKSN